MPSEKNYRLYGFVPYQLSPIQAGIQFGHASVELMCAYPPRDTFSDDVFDWSRYDKTFIVLNGGSLTNLNALLEEFKQQFGETHAFATFNEPDLNNGLSSFVFLVPESEWNWYELFRDDIASFTETEDGGGIVLKNPIPPMRLFLDKFSLYK